MSKQIKITYVYPTDPYIEVMGGMTRYIRFLLKQSLKNNLSVKFIGVKLGKQELQYPGEFKFLPILNGTDTWWKYLLISFLKIPFVKLDKEEIIHSGRLLFLLPYILFHPKNPKILTSDQPRLAFFLAYPQFIYYLFSNIYTPLESFMIHKLKAVIAAEHVVKNYWKKRYPRLDIFKERIYPAVGVDTDMFKPLDKIQSRILLKFTLDSKIILYVGRLSKIKGIDFLIDSFIKFYENESNSLFLIVGRGEDSEKLKNYTNSQLIKNRILFLGEKHGHDLVNIYNCADVLIIGSYAEGNSGVMRESLACGIPVISMNVGDAKDIIINPLLGRVVNERDPKLFAKAILETILLNQESIRKACRCKAYQFSEDVCFETTFKFYKYLFPL